MGDHLARARDYIAIAESSDSKREAYERAADELVAWMREDPTRSYRDADKLLGRRGDYCGKLVRWRTSASAPTALPFARVAGETERKDEHAARGVLDDDERRQRVLDELAPETRGRIAAQLLADPETREAVLDDVRGVAAVESMHHSASTRKTPVRRDDEPLPPPPAFASKFWRAVSAVQDANAELERFGVRGLEALPDTRAAAERMAVQSEHISGAVVDYVVANIATEGA